MRKILEAISVAAVVLLVAGVVAAGAGTELDDPEQFTVVNRPVNAVLTDTGEPGDSAGDLVTFANKLYDETNTDVVGREQGSCIRIDPAKHLNECNFTVFVEGGQIALQGPFFDTRDSVFAVTGGTGVFRNARGVMRMHHRDDGNFDYVFRLIS